MIMNRITSTPAKPTAIAVARRLYDRGFEGMKTRDGGFLFDVKDEQGESVPVWEWDRYYDVNVDEYLFEDFIYSLIGISDSLDRLSSFGQAEAEPAGPCRTAVRPLPHGHG